MSVFHMVAIFLRALLGTQTELATENLALHQQLAVLRYSSKRPTLRNRDRIFRAWLSRLWSNWRSVLLRVQPETAVRWHQRGFKLYRRWKSRSRKPGRPKIDAEIHNLIRRMSLENPFRRTPRIQSELRLLGYQASKATADKYKVRQRIRHMGIEELVTAYRSP